MSSYCPAAKEREKREADQHVDNTHLSHLKSHALTELKPAFIYFLGPFGGFVNNL